MTEGQRLAEFSRAVRDSTIKRLQLVPPGYENWSTVPQAMSFADLAKHLVEADNWLLKMLRNKNLKPVKGRAGLIEVNNRDEFMLLIKKLETTGNIRAEMLQDLSDDMLSEMIFDERFNREVTVWWIIVRGNLDHEIHHRGQMAAYLRALGTTTQSGEKNE